MKSFRGLLLVVGGALLAACAPSAPASQRGPESGPADGPVTSSRTMTMLVRYEVTDLGGKIPGSSSPVVTKRLFNAQLALIDSAGAARPYLAEALPRLNSESWRVFPDGRMQTTYRLRPNLTWHDSRPLTADDFEFALRAYTTPSLTIFLPDPQDRIERAVAVDQRTLRIDWSSIHADAGALIFGDLDPLPRHLLEAGLARVGQESSAADAFVNLPFWTAEYVGAGPYRLDAWVPGSHLEASAFAGHSLGKPKIERLVIRIVNDENAVLSTVLAANADFTADFTLRFEHGLVLKRDWEPLGKGTVVFKPSGPITQAVQLRREYMEHPGMFDLRVRRALAHAIDRQALNEGLFEGQGFGSEGVVPPSVPFFSEVDRSIAKYAYDPRRSEQLMAEAGFAKDREGLFAGAGGERFRTDVRVTAGPEFERGQAILADTWRRAGFDVRSSVLGAAQARDREARQTFPGMASRGGGITERTFTTGDIGSLANRWTGENRGGWSNPEYDRVFDGFSKTIDRDERVRHVVQMTKLVSEELPIYSLYFAIQVNTQVAGLRGPDPGSPGFGVSAPGTLQYWNVQEWELR